ncbi:MAG: ABC transporter permease [Chloroflexi bacterium]|nr:ABC transporter permease [Chloroflexota bacterium]
MNFSENLRVALRALSANKLRSALTMLGIIIGVGAVVALMAIGNGATANITSQVEGIGSNLVFVSPGRAQRGPSTQTARATLYFEDYELLSKTLKNIVGIAPSFSTNGTVTYGTETVTVQVTATTPDYGIVRSSEAANGRFITAADRSNSARVAVLGSQTATDLFRGLNPVGRSIKINGVPFAVVGVLESKGSSGFGNADAIVLVPLETGYEKLFGALATANGKRQVSDISLSAANPDGVNDLILQIERTLRRQHRLNLTDELDFSVLSQTAFLGALNTITATLTAFLGAIAGLSLLVGGIGIMNIMLVSVTERTKEIGLRKAVGAKRIVILIQFLIETVTLSLIGGLLGIGLGWGIAAGVTAANLIQAQVTLSSILLAFFFAAAVGIFFGLYPAWRASRLRPIEALRYE